jgi:apolipoprotein N-acyltransferase
MRKLFTLHPLKLALVSGLLMSLSYPFIGSLHLIMAIALVPLLALEDRFIATNKGLWKIWGYAYMTFFVYNLLCTWWIYFADPIGAVLAVLANSALMATAFWVFSFSKKYIGRTQGYIGFLFIWTAFEYQHFNWELSWPWLNFGHVFMNAPYLIQWYEWTGILGGTLWLLVINLLVYKILRDKYLHQRAIKKLSLVLTTLVAVPVLYSVVRYLTYAETVNPVEIVVTQPNIDAHNEKFGPGMLPWRDQLDSITLVANPLITENTDFVVAPETAIPFELPEETFNQYPMYAYLDSAMRSWNGPDLIIGASTMRYYETKNSVASRPIRDGGFYESYNTSVHMGLNHPHRFVHKSKLVLGVEKIPFIGVLPFLENFAMDLGGASGSLGTETGPVILEGKGILFASLVCYESVYGEFIGDFVRNGAHILFVITNDGWWRDTPGYKQHFGFSRLRAIETRRSVARSANTGISGFINQRGDVLSRSNWDENVALKHTVNLNSEQTIYVRYGDLLGRVSWFVAVLILILACVKYLRTFGSITPYGGRNKETN